VTLRSGSFSITKLNSQIWHHARKPDAQPWPPGPWPPNRPQNFGIGLQNHIFYRKNSEKRHVK
jgi:hypothetical protein